MKKYDIELWQENLEAIFQQEITESRSSGLLVVGCL